MPSLDRLTAINERALAKRIGFTERELAGIYADVLSEIREKLARVYERYAVAGELTRAEMTKYNRLTALEKELNRVMGHGTQLAHNSINRLTADMYQESFFRYGWAIDSDTGLRLNWGVFRPEAIRAAVENPLADIAFDRLRQVSRERIRRTVASGLIRGDSFDRMAREMRRGLALTQSDALRIARTEGGRAQTLGQLECYQKADDLGVGIREFWMASLDDRTRDSHGEMDGVEKTESGFPFPGLGFVEGPRLTGVAAEDINCRCTIRPQVGELAPELRRDRERGIVPFENYNEWQKSTGRA